MKTIKVSTKTISSNNSGIRQESEYSQSIQNYSSVRNETEQSITPMFKNGPTKTINSQNFILNKSLECKNESRNVALSKNTSKHNSLNKIPFFDQTENMLYKKYNFSEGSDGNISPLRLPGNGKVVFEIKRGETESPKRNNCKKFLSISRTTMTNKDPKFISKVDQKVKLKVDLNNSIARSIGDVVRESTKTKTMTNMKHSFDSNLGSDQLAEVLSSKVTNKSNNDNFSCHETGYTNFVRIF
jgi:hypothetical protein